MIKDPHQSKYW